MVLHLSDRHKCYRLHRSQKGLNVFWFCIVLMITLPLILLYVTRALGSKSYGDHATGGTTVSQIQYDISCRTDVFNMEGVTYLTHYVQVEPEIPPKTIPQLIAEFEEYMFALANRLDSLDFVTIPGTINIPDVSTSDYCSYEPADTRVNPDPLA